MLPATRRCNYGMKCIWTVAGETSLVNHLIEIISSKRFWKRGQLDELRALAVQALGEIKGDAAFRMVESAMEDRSDIVAQAANHAMKILIKERKHE